MSDDISTDTDELMAEFVEDFARLSDCSDNNDETGGMDDIACPGEVCDMDIGALSPGSVADRLMSGDDEDPHDGADDNTSVMISSLNDTQTVSEGSDTKSAPDIDEAIQKAMEKLKTRKNTPPYNKFKDCDDLKKLKKDLFTLPCYSDKSRYIVKEGHIECFAIFPWFHLSPSSNGRFRQSISESGRVDKIMQAMKYFWTEDFSDENYKDLENYFRSIMKDAKKIKPLTSISDAWVAMMSLKTTNRMESIQQTVDEHGKRLDNFEERLAGVEGEPSNETSSKRPRRGGDRAQYMSIRPRCRENMQSWCTPGRVFGIYGDGIGPLLSASATFKRHQLSGVVVYSILPDIMEDDVDPTSGDYYVPVVMVGN